MTKREMTKLISELAWYVTCLRKDLSEGFIADMADCLADIQGISCMLEEAVNQRLGKQPKRTHGGFDYEKKSLRVFKR